MSQILFAPAGLWLDPAHLHDRPALADSSACAASWTESSTTPPGPELMYLAAATRGDGVVLNHNISAVAEFFFLCHPAL